MAKILIVRAEPVKLKIEASCLDRSTFMVRMAGSALDALDIAQSLRPDLVVINSDVADATPETLCAGIHAIPGLEKTRMLLVTDSDAREGVGRFTQAGGDGFVLASASPNTVADAVGQLLGIPVRQQDRVPLQVLVKVEELGRDGSPGRSMYATTMDFSESGLSMEAQHPLDLGTRLRVQMVLPGLSRRLAIHARVKRVVDAQALHYAVEFQDVTADQHGLINSFLQSRMLP